MDSRSSAGKVKEDNRTPTLRRCSLRFVHGTADTKEFQSGDSRQFEVPAPNERGFHLSGKRAEERSASTSDKQMQEMKSTKCRSQPPPLPTWSHMLIISSVNQRETLQTDSVRAPNRTRAELSIQQLELQNTQTWLTQWR